MTSETKRPTSLYDVSCRTLDGHQKFDSALREFLDSFYSYPDKRQGSIDTAPLLIDDISDAYLAATAEHLAAVYHLTTPTWAEGHGRPLKKAFFAGGLESLKAILTVESPSAFRRRLLFVGSDALDRPRRLTAPDYEDGGKPTPCR
jgi:hypothetical protein